MSEKKVNDTTLESFPVYWCLRLGVGYENGDYNSNTYLKHTICHALFWVIYNINSGNPNNN